MIKATYEDGTIISVNDFTSAAITSIKKDGISSIALHNSSIVFPELEIDKINGIIYIAGNPIKFKSHSEDTEFIMFRRMKMETSKDLSFSQNYLCLGLKSKENQVLIWIDTEGTLSISSNK